MWSTCLILPVLTVWPSRLDDATDFVDLAVQTTGRDKSRHLPTSTSNTANYCLQIMIQIKPTNWQHSEVTCPPAHTNWMRECCAATQRMEQTDRLTDRIMTPPHHRKIAEYLPLPLMSNCLSVCEQDKSKSHEYVLMKFGEWAEYELD